MTKPLTTDEISAGEMFAIDLAMLAREIAMDIFPLDQILELHRLTDEEWARVQQNQKFKDMLAQMVAEWNATTSTKDRVKIKAATGLESQLETYIRDIGDPTIPLSQRVEAGKFLAKLGELDGSLLGAGAAGGGFQIILNIGERRETIDVTPRHSIEGGAIPE